MEPDPTNTKRKVVFVLLGMHRSGTSLTMSVLQSLGIDCGAALIPAGRGNVAGFWENREIVAVQEELLTAMDRVWHGPRGTFPLPGNWLQSPAAARAKKRLVGIVEKGISESDGIWGFKDPRTCRLLPLWREVFRETDVEPVFILSVRHPSAVSASLARHNGMSLQRGRLAWLVHNLDVLRYCGDDLLLVADYDQLVEHTALEVERLAQALGSFSSVSAEQKAAAVARVSTELRSHSKAHEQILNPVLCACYEGLQGLSRGNPKSETLAQLEENWPHLENLLEPWRTDTRPLLVDWVLRLILRRKYS